MDDDGMETSANHCHSIIESDSDNALDYYENYHWVSK